MESLFNDFAFSVADRDRIARGDFLGSKSTRPLCHAKKHADTGERQRLQGSLKTDAEFENIRKRVFIESLAEIVSTFRMSRQETDYAIGMVYEHKLDDPEVAGRTSLVLCLNCGKVGRLYRGHTGSRYCPACLPESKEETGGDDEK